jgi:uncharacterized protein (DUF3084 family)
VNFQASEFNWQLILIVAAISAVVTYVGDVLGMRLGKRRISLLGMRPRYTSTVITTFTGVGVAILTLLAAAYTSEQVRMAFFGVNYLEREIARLIQDQHEREDQLAEMEIELSMARAEFASMERELCAASADLKDAAAKLESTQKQADELVRERSILNDQVRSLNAEKARMEKSVASLRSETGRLKKGLAEMKEGWVIASQGELLAQTSIESGAASADINAALLRLVNAGEEVLTAKNMSLGNPSADPKVEIDDREREKIYAALKAGGGRKLLRLTAPSNVVQGQVVNGVAEIFDSRIIFKKGDTLMTGTINGGLAQNEAADTLYTMLKHINRMAVSRGVLPDPITGTVGNLDSIDFYEIVDEISESIADKNITFLAADDIYTEGPVDVQILLGN